MIIWYELVFVIKKLFLYIVSLAYVISDLNDEKVVETFYEKELQKTYRKEFRVEKVIKRKGNKIYVKCKGV